MGSYDHNNSQCKRATQTLTGTADLFPAALGAIEDNDLDKMKRLMELENFDKETLDSLLYKAHEVGNDISIEEDFVKNHADISNSEEEQSMLSICQTSRKNNKQVIDLLLEAGSKAKSKNTMQAGSHKTPSVDLGTPTKPRLRSNEKNEFVATPEAPKFKSAVYRNIKF